jgi:hypothetical protein
MGIALVTDSAECGQERDDSPRSCTRRARRCVTARDVAGTRVGHAHACVKCARTLVNDWSDADEGAHLTISVRPILFSSCGGI